MSVVKSLKTRGALQPMSPKKVRKTNKQQTKIHSFPFSSLLLNSLHDFFFKTELTFAVHELANVNAQ